MRNDKAARRKKKLAARALRWQKLELKHKRRGEFPAFVIDDTYGDPQFVSLVKVALKQFNFEELPKPDQTAFRTMKKHGAMYAMTRLREAMQLAKSHNPKCHYAQLGDILWQL